MTANRVLSAAILFVFVAFAFACNSATPQNQSTATPAPPASPQPIPQEPPIAPPASESPSMPEIETPSPPPADDSNAYTGPPVTVQVMQAKRKPPISTAIIEATVPTGGWTLAIDETKIEGDLAKIYLTLEGPGQDEVVTQVLTTLNQTFTSENPPFEHADVYVHVARRDIQTLTTNYRLAASD